MKNIIILVYPKITFEKNYPCSWIPYSLLSLASVLHKNTNIDVFIFDQNRDDESTFNILLKKHGEKLLCIGFSIMTGGGQIKNALYLAAMAKEVNSEIMTVFGGPHVNVLPEETLRNKLVDVVLQGLGQNSFPAFIDALKGDDKYENVPGLIMKKKSEFLYGIKNELNNKLLPQYYFDLIDVNQYIQKDNTIAERTINYISTQGCAYSCRFCYEINYAQKYYKMSVDNVISDIKYFIDRYYVNGIKFYDADWFIDKNRAENLIECLTDFKVNWAASIHPNDILTSIKKSHSLLEKLSKSNCKRLLMGIESGSNRVLSNIVNKRITKENIFKIAKDIANYGILGSYTFIVGFPGETEEEQQETFDFIEQLWNLNPRPETRVHIYTPYPGTPLYNDAIQHGFNPPDNLESWSDFDYYKAQTPWTNEYLEQKVSKFTAMINKM
jgi:radical SAM superfamily enzyme YgiQ (UPF0313 family)